MKAADIVLTQGTIDRIDTIFAPGAIRGARYAAPLQAQVSTELLPGEELAPLS